MSRPAPALRAAAAALPALLVAALAACAGSGTVPEPDDEVLVVFAAASLSDALAEAAEAVRGDGDGDGDRGAPVRFNFAGSNTLAQQILHGPSPDLFVSADRRQMERLVEAGRVAEGAVRPLLTNTLVVVVPAAGAAAYATAADLRRARRVAVADPAGVPAGVYARRWLEAEGLWQELEPRLIPALDVRAALAAVTGGHVDAGIVYATDAATTSRARVAFTAPPATAPRVTYVAATPQGGDAAAAGAFLDHLTAGPGRAILERHGFGVLP